MGAIARHYELRPQDVRGMDELVFPAPKLLEAYESVRGAYRVELWERENEHGTYWEANYRKSEQGRFWTRRTP